jgi:hypothetical protein
VSLRHSSIIPYSPLVTPQVPLIPSALPSSGVSQRLSPVNILEAL